MRSRKVIGGILFVAFFVFLLQSISFLLRSHWEGGVCNTAAAWNVDVPLPVLLFISFSILGIFFALWLRERNFSRNFIWVMLLAAGMSNFLERLIYGCVFDYMNIPPLPLFNAADALLTGGVVFFLVSYLWKNEKSLSDSSK